jgi:hypothetical protein
MHFPSFCGHLKQVYHGTLNCNVKSILTRQNRNPKAVADSSDSMVAVGSCGGTAFVRAIEPARATIHAIVTYGDALCAHHHSIPNDFSLYIFLDSSPISLCGPELITNYSRR